MPRECTAAGDGLVRPDFAEMGRVPDALQAAKQRRCAVLLVPLTWPSVLHCPAQAQTVSNSAWLDPLTCSCNHAAGHQNPSVVRTDRFARETQRLVRAPPRTRALHLCLFSELPTTAPAPVNALCGYWGSAPAPKGRACPKKVNVQKIQLRHGY